MTVTDHRGDEAVGLCRRCRHVQVITSGAGSTFYLCTLSKSDPRFAKYPRLPVLSCAGYEDAPAQGNTARDESLP